MGKYALIFAAGMGRRMMPLTADKPKPMVEVFGKPMIGHILDHLQRAGITNIVVNAHYKADILKSYLETRKDLNIKISYETDILDTGGGIANAKNMLPKDEAFFVINGDAYWDAAEDFVLPDLASAWHDDMDILLLLQDKCDVREGAGDYNFTQNQRIKRCLDQNGDYMFTGIRIVHPRILNDLPIEKFSFLKCMDEAQYNGTLYGFKNKGLWHHLSTPQDIEALEQIKKQTKQQQNHG